ncbi:unnamed protein product [Notodromas monacha]|uniref:L-serine ammonia-lyase n=1 Tax=Notodromas monacha TaxID=399045 RepID=A0A7R9BYS3_9CRUS|nr:unnamed protein product [Notodromas monacha]CAG0924213.1 unnamed protein product [Notodromas monacha]
MTGKRREYLHIETPFLRLAFANKYLPAAGRDLKVFGKFENMQPSGSFKLRGLGYLASKAVANGATGICTSSGGNAAYAVAYSAQVLGVPYTVCLPTSTPAFVVNALAAGEKSTVIAVANGATGICTSSGGNAAYAVAYSAQVLGVPYTVCLPTSTPAFVVNALAAGEKSTVILHGKNWDEAHAKLLSIVEESQGKLYLIHPFDHPDIW